MTHLIFIKYLPKDQLIYQLWRNAKYSYMLKYCPMKRPELSIDYIRKDIINMLNNKFPIYLGMYYGKDLFIDISGDYLNAKYYDKFCGKYSAKKIISNLKLAEMKKSIMRYYII